MKSGRQISGNNFLPSQEAEAEAISMRSISSSTVDPLKEKALHDRVADHEILDSVMASNR
jgi:hypothetical protein